MHFYLFLSTFIFSYVCGTLHITVNLYHYISTVEMLLCVVPMAQITTAVFGLFVLDFLPSFCFSIFCYLWSSLREINLQTQRQTMQKKKAGHF